MSQRWWKIPAVLLVAVCTLTFVQPAQAQVGVVTIKSVDEVIANVRYVLTLVGKENEAKQLDEIIKAVTKGDGLKGVDSTRPLGAYFDLPAVAGDPPIAIGFVPVSKEDDFLNLLKTVQVEVEKGKDGLYSLTLPDPDKTSLYLRFANKYAYAAKEEAHLKGKLVDPATLLPAAGKNNTIAASLRIDAIPKEYKQIALAGIKQAQENEKDRRPGESEAEYQGRLAGMKIASDAMISVIENSQELTLGLQVDRQKDLIALELALVPKSGTTLAKTFSNFGATRSLFAGLTKDSAMNLLVTLPIADDLRQAIGKFFDQAFQEALKAEQDAKVKALAQKFFKALEPTVKADSIDIGVVLQGPHADKTYSVAFGLKVKEGKELEKVFREAAKEIPATGKATVKLDHAKARDGTAIHYLQAGDELDPDAKRVLGAGDIYFAIRNDAVLVTIGKQGLKQLQDALDAVGKPAGDAAPVQFEFSLARLAPLAPQQDEAVADAIKKVFQGADKDKDKVRISLQGGNALRIRVEMNAQIIKFGAAVRE